MHYFCFLVVRDPDGYIYLRERDGCILAGGFEPVAKPVYEEESEYKTASCEYGSS